MAQQQEQQKKGNIPFRPEFLEEVELNDFQIDGSRLLIRYEEIKEHIKTDGGVHLGEAAESQIREAVIVKGEIVSVGNLVQNPDYKPGVTVFFYKGQSQGAVRVGKNTPLWIYEEYTIYGHNKTIKPKIPVGIIGVA